VDGVTFPKGAVCVVCSEEPASVAANGDVDSNGGRHYPPWSGRHINVVGLEEVTSWFHVGLAESVAKNPVSEKGFPTSAVLREGESLVGFVHHGNCENPGRF